MIRFLRNLVAYPLTTAGALLLLLGLHVMWSSDAERLLCRTFDKILRQEQDDAKT